MSAITKIEWSDRSWNPVRGCALVSDGCRHCYAMKVAHRFSGPGGPYEGLTEIGPAGPRWNGQVRTIDEALTEPLRWKKPQRIFVNSMSDLFHEDVPDVFIDRVFAVMALCPHHTFQILTKRPERMRAYLADEEVELRVSQAADWERELIGVNSRLGYDENPAFKRASAALVSMRWPLPNVWLGVSVENQQAADERIPLLLQTPAAVRYISAEPLLGPIRLVQQDPPRLPDGRVCWPPTSPRPGRPWLAHIDCPDDYGYWEAKLHGIGWVIVGGESGHGARPCELAWIRSIVQQCRDARTPCFVKQLGSNARTNAIVGYDDAMLRLELKDRKGGDITEWPEDLRVRQFPTAQGEAVSAETPEYDADDEIDQRLDVEREEGGR